MKARARADLCLVSGSSSLPAHQTWINVGFVVEVVNYSLKQLLGTNKALSLHEGKLQEVKWLLSWKTPSEPSHSICSRKEGEM